jgi:REP element-mobilizing transposase RayT
MAELRVRKRNRLDGYDYSHSGLYFITVCSKKQERIFSEIRESRVHLYDIGAEIEAAILNIPNKYSSVFIHNYVIMPNHIHLILEIDRAPVNTAHLSMVMNQFKGAVTKQIGYSPWHKSFHDHIIRDHNDFNRIVNYIENNPDNWGKDCFNRK